MEHILQSTYLWLKAGHIIFVIFWMAGLFMLPRYFVYHQESEKGSPEEQRWIERERRIRSIILNPAMVMTWILGLLTASAMGAWSSGGWLHAKLFIVLLLSGYHGWLVAYSKKLARGEWAMSGKALRMLNEVPGLTAAIIVVLVVIKPF